jgi:uncharacterized membrane protein required for colicin V production
MWFNGTTMPVSIYWIDWLYVLLLTMTVWVQWDRGLLSTIADLSAWFLGLVTGFFVGSYVAEGLVWYTSLPADYIELVCFFMVTVMVVYVVNKVLIRLFERVTHQNLRLAWQRFVGGLAAAGYAVLVLIFVTHLIVLVETHIPQGKEALEQSWFFGRIYLPWSAKWMSGNTLI